MKSSISKGALALPRLSERCSGSRIRHLVEFSLPNPTGPVLAGSFEMKWIQHSISVYTQYRGALKIIGSALMRSCDLRSQHVKNHMQWQVRLKRLTECAFLQSFHPVPLLYFILQ